MVRSIVLDEQMKVAGELVIDPIVSVLDAAAQQGRFLVLGDSRDDRIVSSVIYDKAGSIYMEQTLHLLRTKDGMGSRASLVLKDKNAYIGSGWAGVEMLTLNGTTWSSTYDYTIPKLPASSIATWGDMVVLAAADLKLYDVQQPTKPSLLSTTALASSVKSVVGAGSFVLCLTRDTLSLRRMDRLTDTVTSVPIAGQQICFDKLKQLAYVLKAPEKKTTVVTKVQVYSNSLATGKVYNLQGSFARASANGGALVLAGVNDISLFKVDDSADPVGTRHFENYAIRDVVLTDDYILTTAVDQNSKGFLLVLAADQKDLNVIGSVDLPHDAVALACAKTRAIAIGCDPSGKNLATIIDLSQPSAPRIVKSIPIIEAASAVTIKEQMAFIAGRGLEILSLS